MIFLGHLILLCLAIPAGLACLYLLISTLLSAALRVPARSSRRLQFDVIVPAHNEAAVIERTVASLKKIEWPADRFRVWVVADNCSDSTASLARTAGAHVWERHDTSLRGKGYALQYAFGASLGEGWANAVVVVDADAEVSVNLLEAFAARIESGAHAVQAHYGVLNPMASWRTRLITIAKASFHIVRSRQGILRDSRQWLVRDARAVEDSALCGFLADRGFGVRHRHRNGWIPGCLRG
jgi:glycosyltransferase involved in cell wall biosynthesis